MDTSQIDKARNANDNIGKFDPGRNARAFLFFKKPQDVMPVPPLDAAPAEVLDVGEAHALYDAGIHAAEARQVAAPLRNEVDDAPPSAIKAPREN